jgi:O-methyltransferase
VAQPTEPTRQTGVFRGCDGPQYNDMMNLRRGRHTGARADAALAATPGVDSDISRLLAENWPRAPMVSPDGYERRMSRFGRAYERLSMPFAVFFLFANRRIDPAYHMSWGRKIRLATRIYHNWRRVPTGVSYKAHLAMAAKLLELSPSVDGAVVECGCWLGGTTANLSLICDIVGRDLIVYDSFEGLPTTKANERLNGNIVAITRPGSWRGDLDTVKRNVRRYGAIARCQFRKGWFADTLRHHEEPIVLCFLDVDLKSSLHDCVVNLWPHITARGYLFLDEYMVLDHCALFFSEWFWREYFDQPPPGLIGTGTGIGVGQYCLNLWLENPPGQRATSLAYTRKDLYALWDYKPSESQGEAEQGKRDGDIADSPSHHSIGL